MHRKGRINETLALCDLFGSHGFDGALRVPKAGRIGIGDGRGPDRSGSRDEPTGNLDKSTTKAVMETLTEAGRGKTVFMITHNEELTAYADEVYHLQAGKLE